MDYAERMENVAVLGAAGKMGSGILLLTAIEMADLSLKPENKDKQFILYAVDVSDQALKGVMGFLRDQTRKIAEKKTVMLRKVYEDREDLIENSEIIDQYIFDVLNIVRPTTRIESAYEANLVFEAIIENPDIKVKILSQIDQNNEKKPWFFSNTSSIPIHQLNEQANLGGRILGFHFYNPPAVQKLVELIAADTTVRAAVDFAQTYAKNLRKVVVPSNDFAGFIGNGHFMRDALHGISEARELAKDRPLHEAIYMINKVSQDYLVRPMGIFQLIDYVGIDVCQYIMSVMNPHVTDEDIHSDLLDEMISIGVKGGQYSNGSQKDGFLKYEKGRPVGVYNMDKKEYVAIEEFQAACDDRLGSLPDNYKPWKAVIGNKKKDEVLAAFFNDIAGLKTMGAGLAMRYGQKSRAIGLKLVSDNVARCEEDVNTVLLTGFFHAYGPINEYFK